MSLPRIVVSLATVWWRRTASQAVAAWRPHARIMITRGGRRGPVEKYLAGDRPFPESDIVIICDDDYEYPAELLHQLVAGLASQPLGTVVQGRRGGHVLEGLPPTLRRVKARGGRPEPINFVGGGCTLAFARADFDRVQREILRSYVECERYCDDYTASRAIARCDLRAVALDIPTPPAFPCATDPRSLYRRDDGIERILTIARGDTHWWLLSAARIKFQKRKAEREDLAMQARARADARAALANREQERRRRR